MFETGTMEECVLVFADVFDLSEDVSTDGESVGISATPSGGSAGEPRYLPLYNFEACIRFHEQRFDAQRFKRTPPGVIFVKLTT